MRSYTCLIVAIALALGLAATSQAQTRLTVREITRVPEANLAQLQSLGIEATQQDIDNLITFEQDGNEVEFTAVVLTDPYKSGLASWDDGANAPGRVHVVVRDTSANSQGYEGMSLQLVDGTASILAMTPGFVYDIVGNVSEFGNVVQLAPSFFQAVGSLDDLGLPNVLLEPIDISTDDLNRVVGVDGGGNDIYQANWLNFNDLNWEYVRFPAAVVEDRVEAPAGRPNYQWRSVGGEAVVNGDDISLRYRNDRAFSDGYPNPPYATRPVDDPFIPPETGETIRIQGFAALRAFDFDNEIAGEAMSVTPWEDSDLVFPPLPIAVDDEATTAEDSGVTINVLANDTDPDGSTLVVVSVSDPPNGSVTLSGSAINYSPDPDFFGTDSFTYTIQNESGGTDMGIVTVTVTAVPDDPIANDDDVATPEDTGVIINVLANDVDPDAGTLSVSSISDASNGSVTLNGNLVNYVPSTDFFGTDSFTYAISNSSGLTDEAIVTVTVTAVNDDPVANDDFAETEEDQPVSIPVLINDEDVEMQTLVVAAVSDPQNGSAFVDGEQVVYSPAQDFFGTDSFTYTVEDGNGGSDVATVTVEVSPVNDPPVATDDDFVVDEDDPSVLDVLSNDSDVDGDALIILSATQPEHGTVTIDDGGLRVETRASIQIGQRRQSPGGMRSFERVESNDRSARGQTISARVDAGVSVGGSVILYTPNSNYNGPDAFTYTVSDGNGGTAQANVTLIVQAVNDAPQAADDSAETEEDTPVTIDVLANDFDKEGDELQLVSVSEPGNGEATINGSEIVYAPAPDFNGEDGFSYTISDANGEEATANVVVTVLPVNDPPGAASITQPANGSSILLAGSPETPLVVEWTAAEDVDGDDISYRWLASLVQGDFTDPIFESETSNTSLDLAYGFVDSTLAAEGIGAGASAAVYHRVVTSDGQLQTVGATATVTLQRGTLVSNEESIVPTEFNARGVYPNPSVESASISLDLPWSTTVRVRVYDVMGRRVAEVEQRLSSGREQVISLEASTLSPGVYVYVVSAESPDGTQSSTGRLTVVR
jgi:hypothetical protein